MQCCIRITCCTCHTNVNVLMSAFASSSQGPWNPLGWKVLGTWKGLMTGFGCHYPPTETPTISMAEGEFSAWSTQLTCSFCCCRKPRQEWPTAPRGGGGGKEGWRAKTLIIITAWVRLTTWLNAVLSTFHLILMTTVLFYIFQMGKLGQESD